MSEPLTFTCIECGETVAFGSGTPHTWCKDDGTWEDELALANQAAQADIDVDPEVAEMYILLGGEG